MPGQVSPILCVCKEEEGEKCLKSFVPALTLQSGKIGDRPSVDRVFKLSRLQVLGEWQYKLDPASRLKLTSLS